MTQHTDIGGLVERLRELLAAAPGTSRSHKWIAAEDGLPEKNNVTAFIVTRGELVSYGHMKREARDLIVEAVNALPQLLDAIEALSIPQGLGEKK